MLQNNQNLTVPAANNYDVTVSTFPEIIIEGSKQKPILVIFWSNQCPVCQQLLPLVNAIHAQKNEAFTVARINFDTQQQIVSHFGVSSVPSVFMFKDGQGVDGFAGEQDETYIREFIAKHTPDQAQQLLQLGQTHFSQGLLVESKNSLLSAKSLAKDNNEINLALAQVYLALGEHESAKVLLDKIPMVDQNMIYHSLLSQLELALQSAQTPEITLLESKIDDATETTLSELQYQLAIQYNQANRNKEALQLLLKILTMDIGFGNGEAKKTVLDILATIDDQALISEYRRKLYSLLY